MIEATAPFDSGAHRVLHASRMRNAMRNAIGDARSQSAGKRDATTSQQVVSMLGFMHTDPAVLLVEDDPAAADLMRFTLKQAGYRPIHAGSAEAALDCVKLALPAAALIDHMLPRMSGIQLLRQLRRGPRTATLPLIMVTALADEQQRIDGLEAGADDYVAKPFSPRELIARLRAVIRRRSPERSEARMHVGRLVLDPVSREVTIGERRIPVRQVEFSLLHTMMARPERVFTRDELLDRVWGESAFVEERTVDVHIRRLRSALGEPYATMLETVRGRGYMLTARATPGD